MSHYKNGRLAVIGDPVIVRPGNKAFAGTLVQIFPGATTCNGTVIATVPQEFPPRSYYQLGNDNRVSVDENGKAQILTTSQISVNLSDTLHADDAFDGITGAPPAKAPEVEPSGS